MGVGGQQLHEEELPQRVGQQPPQRLDGEHRYPLARPDPFLDVGRDRQTSTHSVHGDGEGQKRRDQLQGIPVRFGPEHVLLQLRGGEDVGE